MGQSEFKHINYQNTGGGGDGGGDNKNGDGKLCCQTIHSRVTYQPIAGLQHEFNELP